MMKMSDKTIVTLAICAALCGCSDSQKKGGASMQLDEVAVASPLVKPIEEWDDYTARIEAANSVEIRARVSGYLTKINFSEGQLVKKGDLLFIVDPRPYEAKVMAAKARIKEIEARLALAKSNVARAKNMYKSTVISKEELDTRNAELLAQEASLASAKAELRDAELNLEFTHIIAPVSGRVSESLLDEGNLVTADSSLLTTIEKNDVVQAYFEASERDIVGYDEMGLFQRIDQKNLTGPEVELSLMTSESGRVFKGMVTYFDNRIGRSTSSLTMRADVKNEGERLKPGMFAKLRMKVSDARDSMLVRETAIGTDMVGRFVYVVGKDGKIAYKAVKVGKLIGPYRVIEEGLSKDDKVVVKGLHNAVVGRPVKAIETSMDAE